MPGTPDEVLNESEEATPSELLTDNTEVFEEDSIEDSVEMGDDTQPETDFVDSEIEELDFEA